MGQKILGVLAGFPWYLPKHQGKEDQGRAKAFHSPKIVLWITMHNNMITDRHKLYWTYHSSQNHYTHKIIIFKLFRSLQLQFSGPTGINFHYSYSFVVLT